MREALWAQRRQLFFKPADGYGSKAAYRGDKLTRRVWGEIVAGNFVAQALVPPSERLVDVAGVADAAEARRPRLRIRWPDPAARRANLLGPDHQFPHCRRRLLAHRGAAFDHRNIHFSQ